MGRGESFPALIACLQGLVPEKADWESLIAIANQSLTTATLASRLIGQGDTHDLPDEVKAFLTAVLERNTLRNRRLEAQLCEAAQAMNASGIYPALMKGAAMLMQTEGRETGSRILSDIDFMVAPSMYDMAVNSLIHIGYQIEERSDTGQMAVVLFRPDDAATIDLHCSMPGLPIDGDLDFVLKGARKVRRHDAEAWLPSPTLQILFLILHDLVKGQDYLRGLIDLRHLIDIDRLARSAEGVDWAGLAELLPAYGNNAMHVQMLTAKKLFGTPIPEGLRRGLWAHFQYMRRIIQIRWTALMPLMTLVTIILDPRYYLARRAARRQTMPGVEMRDRFGWSFIQRRKMNIEQLFRTYWLGKI